MDDLCDSLDTIKQAEKQTEDIDKVLETGGFRVIPHPSKDRHSKIVANRSKLGPRIARINPKKVVRILQGTTLRPTILVLCKIHASRVLN